MNEELATETVDQAQQPAVQPAEQAQADMSAGFNKVRGITPDEPAKAEPVQAAVEETPPAEVEEPEKPQPPTQDQLRAELEQFRGQTAAETQKLHGKIGELNRTLQAFQAAPTPANSQAHKAALEKLTAEYPELAETLGPLFGGASVPTEVIQQIVQEQVGQIKAETTQTITQLRAEISLAKAHPDYEEVAQTPEYAKWLASKPADYQKAFNTSWDPKFISTGLTEFKTWKSTVYAKEQQRQARLEGAVTPTGVPNRSQAKLPDSAGLSAGFNRVRKAR